jgi:nicotinate dehydrogenase subunit A
MPTSVSLDVNDRAVTIIVDDPGMPLLYALRDNLELKGPRFGCGLGQCGACAVLLDGEPALSCKTSLSAAANRKVLTLEGLGSPEKPSPVQRAFIDEQAAQCGYCLNGMIIQATALLAKSKNPTVGEIRKALADNLCRCGTHLRVVRAVQRAARNA